MKRSVCLALALCLLLCGCAGKAEETTAATTVDTTPETTAEPTTEATTLPPETTEPPVIYRHSLNGQILDEPWTGKATAIVINNIRAALPQFGISQADIIYELETESGITRLLAVYSDLANVGSIGPVRSARTFFNNIALSHDAVLVHCGGSQFALNGNYSDNGDTISNWQHINEQSYGSYFFRDYTRYNSGYAWEHTLFTNSENLLQALSDMGYDTTYEGDGYDHGLTFAEEPELTGDAANKVTVTFRGTKTTTMEYDTETGLYKASQYGSAWMDAGVGEQLSFRNVIVIHTPQYFRSDAYYSRSFYTLSGSGEGHFFCDGKVIPITWHRDALRGSFTYTLEDGTPLTLGVGTTYVGVVDSSRGSVSYE